MWFVCRHAWSATNSSDNLCFAVGKARYHDKHLGFDDITRFAPTAAAANCGDASRTLCCANRGSNDRVVVRSILSSRGHFLPSVRRLGFFL